jgi:ribosome-associated protein
MMEETTEETLKEKSLHPVEADDVAAGEHIENGEELVKGDNRISPYSVLDDRIKLALKCADEKKGIGITALDLRDITSFTEFFVIVSGLNTRQVQAITDEIDEQLKKQLKQKPFRVEGYSTGTWILMDYGDFIVHVFEDKMRNTYDLERLWRDSKRVVLPEEL